MKESIPEENKMGIQPVNRLLLSMSVPIMLSMLVQALYNVVDSYFVAQISENAFNAVSLAFPVQNLMIAVASGTGVGINALLSKFLGEKDSGRSNLTAGNGIFLTLCSYAAFAMLCGLFARPFFAVQTDVPEIVDCGAAYIFVCGVFSFGIFFQITLDRLLLSTGKTIYTMVTQLVGAVINIVLDPVFIFGLKMGVTGAAIATVLGQIAAAGLSVWFNLRHNREIQITLQMFHPDGKIIREIYAVGIPTIIMSAISSIMTFGMNMILISFTTTATAVLGAYFKLQSFVFMPVLGLNSAAVPIIAYNLGARQPERIMKAAKLGILYATAIGGLGGLLFQIAGGPLLRIFDASDYMLEIGIPALRVIGSSFFAAGFGMMASSVFQALRHGGLSLIMSLVRQLVILLPVAWLLKLTGRLGLVWWAFPISEIMTGILCVFFLWWVYRREIKPMFQTDSEAG